MSQEDTTQTAAPIGTEGETLAPADAPTVPADAPADGATTQ